MDMTGERRIPAPRQIVWEALNNPEVLKVSIPGCETLEKLSDTQMKATAAVKLGPISARFTGNVQLSEIDPPTSYRISGEGQGGVAGFAKGGALVTLADDAADTLLSYQVNATVGGKLAQLGARLIDASAKQMADQFFDRFSKQVQAMNPAAGEPMPLATSAVTSSAELAPAVVAPVEVAPANVAPVEAPPLGAPPVRMVPGGTVPIGAPAADRAIPTAPAAVVHATSAPAFPPRVTPAPLVAPPPPSAISVLALIPPEPFGLPIAAWIGSAIFVILMLLMFGSML